MPTLHSSAYRPTRTILARSIALACFIAAQPAIAADIDADKSDTKTEVLPAVQVRSSSEDKVAEALNPKTAVGSKIALTQREIPQSVSVISQEQIKSQNLLDLKQALRATPGVSITNVDTSRIDVYSRGFAIDTLDIDGVSTPMGYLTPPSLAMYERVEVLRGPAGLFSGSGGPGGTINMVRKRAPKTFEMSAETGIGNYGTYHEQVDVGGPLNAAGTVRGRVVAAIDNAKLRQTGTHRSDTELFGTLEADLTPQTLLRVGTSYQRFTGKSMQYGYPTYTNGSFLNVNPSTYYGGDWNHESYFLTTAFAALEHKLGNGWTTQMSVNYRDMRRDTNFAGLRGAVTTGSTTSSYQTSRSGAEDVQKILDVSASGPFTLFGRQHTLLVGMNLMDENNPTSTIPGNPRTIAVNLADPVDPALPSFSANKSVATTYTDEYAFYSNARFNLTDRLTMVLGGRATWWRSSVDPDPTYNANAVAATSGSVNGHLTPYAGLIYDINDTYSVYASYTKIFEAQSDLDSSGNMLKPLEGEQYEVGVKGSYLNDRVTTSLALFDLTQKNRAIALPGGTTTVYEAQGKARSRGFETQVTGRVLPGWDVSLGYSYTAARYLDASADTGKTAFAAYTPKHMFKMWTNYRLPGSWSKLSVGGSLYVTSAYASVNSTATIRQAGFATVDLSANYDFDKHTSVAVNVSNLFNRTYYQSLGSTTDHNYLGDPRLAMVTLRYHY